MPMNPVLPVMRIFDPISAANPPASARRGPEGPPGFPAPACIPAGMRQRNARRLLVRIRRSNTTATPAVGLGADQPSESLPEPENGFRQGILIERIFEGFTARGDDRIARHVKRQFGQHQNRKRLAGNVHALPKGPGSQQHGLLRGLERFQQRMPRSALPLLIDDDPLAGQRPLDDLRRLPQLGIGGEEDERPAARGLAQFHQSAVERMLVGPRIPRFRDVGREVQQGGILEIERRTHHQRFRLVGVQPLAEVIEFPGGGEGGGGQHHGMLGVPEEFFHQRPDVQRRGKQRPHVAVARDLHPVDHLRIGLGDDLMDGFDGHRHPPRPPADQERELVGIFLVVGLPAADLLPQRGGDPRRFGKRRAHIFPRLFHVLPARLGAHGGDDPVLQRVFLRRARRSARR